MSNLRFYLTSLVSGLIICLLLASCSGGSSGTGGRNITGSLSKDSDGTPLIGVQVSILETGEQATTDVEGFFQIFTTENLDSISFSFIGAGLNTTTSIQDIPADAIEIDVSFRGNTDTNQVNAETVDFVLNENKEESPTQTPASNDSSNQNTPVSDINESGSGSSSNNPGASSPEATRPPGEEEESSSSENPPQEQTPEETEGSNSNPSDSGSSDDDSSDSSASNPPDHAGEQGPPDHAGEQGPPDHAGGNGPPDHAGEQGPPDHAGSNGPPDNPGGGSGKPNSNKKPK